MSDALRIRVLGCPVDTLNMDRTLETVLARVDRGEPTRHSCVSAAKLDRMRWDDALREAVVTSDIVSADGAGVLWAARVLGRPIPPRVTGIALFLRLVASAARRGESVYLLGDRPQVVLAVQHKLEHAWPGLRIVGAHHGYNDDDEAVVAQIRAAAPTYLFVAMGTPRQECFQHRWHSALDVPFMMGVGGSFSVVANVAWRAPVSFGDAGLEWLYRLAQDPRRLLRRNVVSHAGFMAAVVAERLGGTSRR